MPFRNLISFHQSIYSLCGIFFTFIFTQVNCMNALCTILTQTNWLVLKGYFAVLHCIIHFIRFNWPNHLNCYRVIIYRRTWNYCSTKFKRKNFGWPKTYFSSYFFLQWRQWTPQQTRQNITSESILLRRAKAWICVWCTDLFDCVPVYGKEVTIGTAVTKT